MKAKTFCLAPWTHGLVNTDLTMRPCCNVPVSTGTLQNRSTWWNSPYMKNLRSSLYNGVRHSDCSRCWNDEDAGKESLRLNYNNLFRKYIPINVITDSARNDFVLDQEPVTWDLRLGNLCNLKCVMCNSRLSDKIEQEVNNNFETILEIFPDKLIKNNTAILSWADDVDAVSFLNEIKSSVRWLKLQGGEPLAVKTVRDLIISLDPKQTTVAITTNGTILDSKLIESLSSMDSVEISISIEAASEANNIIRYGSEWDTIKSNILALKNIKNVNLQINHVLQITSVFYLKEIIEFCEENNLHLALLELSDPSFLRLEACPEDYLIDFATDIEKVSIKHPKNQYIKQYVLNKILSTKFNQNLWSDFKQYVKLLDTIRPNKYSSVLKFKELL